MDVLRIKQDLIDSLVNDDLDRICKYCGESFLYVNRLVTHLQLVHGVERPFQCPRCDKSYPQRFMLNHHVRKNHGPLVVCAHCGFTAIELAQLERHIRRMHENEAPISAATPVVKDYYNVSLHGFFIQ
uniref:C2H2-type domain-containing protein n=1 Tax=Trichogramma kaykai TaxID=54128 RepID=A0ABD2WQZ0_9HYME